MKIKNDLISLELYYRNLEGNTTGKIPSLVKEMRKSFKDYKSISMKESIKFLEERMKGMIFNRNTTRNKLQKKNRNK